MDIETILITSVILLFIALIMLTIYVIRFKTRVYQTKLFRETVKANYAGSWIERDDFNLEDLESETADAFHAIFDHLGVEYQPPTTEYKPAKLNGKLRNDENE